MIEVQALHALRDNYIWLIQHPPSRSVWVVDPGDAEPVCNILQHTDWQLRAILITHHHWDHTNGIHTLLQHYSVPVYGPSNDPIADRTHPLDDYDVISWPEFGLALTALHTPGHTHGHISFLGHHCLFSGDTLFTAGCGRLFEGNAAQLYHSLCRLAALPETTQVYCGHEYTQANLEFARTVEPENVHIQHRLNWVSQQREQGLPTVPAPLALERQTNPFLRCHIPSVQARVSEQAGQMLTDPVAVFAALRHWKDHF